MTPAIRLLERTGVPHRIHAYRHDAQVLAFGIEAATALKLDPDQVFKTLVVSDGEFLATAMVPVSKRLDLKAMARCAGRKRVALAAADTAERVTGYVVGGISPLAQRKCLPAWADRSVASHETVFVSAGRRGLEIELAPADLARLTGAHQAAIAR